jgi:hypothetical protein
MKTYRISTVVEKDGTVTIANLPFHSGEELEVVLRSRGGGGDPTKAHPLRGEAVKYKDPFGNVAEDDWDALK